MLGLFSEKSSTNLWIQTNHLESSGKKGLARELGPATGRAPELGFLADVDEYIYLGRFQRYRIEDGYEAVQETLSRSEDFPLVESSVALFQRGIATIGTKNLEHECTPRTPSSAWR
jgi:hypothetical protein